VFCREDAFTVGTFIRELIHVGVYKRSQGRITRQVTFAALALAVTSGLWRLSVMMAGHGPVMQFAMPFAIWLGAMWICYRAVNLPAFADFLIAVEAEINKVSWPTWHELFRASLVVIVVIFALALLLAGYDIFWKLIFRMLGIA
jgi:preprotein translocase subunit SecE